MSEAVPPEKTYHEQMSEYRETAIRADWSSHAARLGKYFGALGTAACLVGVIEANDMKSQLGLGFLSAFAIGESILFNRVENTDAQRRDTAVRAAADLANNLGWHTPRWVTELAQRPEGTTGHPGSD